jgi:hypothetical protein
MAKAESSESTAEAFGLLVATARNSVSGKRLTLQVEGERQTVYSRPSSRQKEHTSRVAIQGRRHYPKELVKSTLKLIEDGVRVPGLARNGRQGSGAERKALREILGLQQNY